MIFQRLTLAAVACALTSGAFAAGVTPITGAVDIGGITGVLNNIIGQINGVQCVASGATPQTCNGTRGVVTTNTLSTAAVTNAAFVINNSLVTTNSVMNCNLTAYSGTLVTNGVPVILTCVPGASTITVNIYNAGAANALNGTLNISFAVEQN